ncbi:sigma-70 family RNA polymerase sigma factor [Ruminococcus sp. FC2018]|uniref:sigma-70 family RNA polymerase sigma factor n=1 Tax=Ruminococcus sp. FC2018 TaxID=1410617 RepID=UPI0004920AE4|nr:sigma-70 family RNA polymerase sigma factor [Ruminococcus sp. FC2018]
MRIQYYHKKDNESVVSELPTPLELFKQTHTKQEYEQLVSFYKSEQWQEVERAHLNSDRRYYEGRKEMSLSEHSKMVSSKSKFYGVHPFQKRVENKLIKRIEDRFEDKLLCESMKALTPKQYQVIELFLKDRNTDEIAKAVGTTPGNVRKLRKRALEKLRTEYARLAMGCHEEYTGKIPYNIKRLCKYLARSKPTKKRKKAA